MASARNTLSDGHLLEEKSASTECRAIFEYQFPAEAFWLPGLWIAGLERQKIG